MPMHRGLRISTSSSMAAVMMLAAGVLTSSPARARVEVEPYIELDQTVIANVKGGNDDVLTYTSAAVGVDGAVTSRRTEAQVSLRYEHQFGWNSSTPDQDILSGIARARYQIVPGALSIEGGGIATRVRTDGLYSATGSLANAGDATSEIYSFFVGPTFNKQIGDLSVGAAYRFGYTRVEDDVSFTTPGTVRLGAYDDSYFHSFSASVGQKPGNLPVGWTVSGGYDREDASELDQRYEDGWARLDLTVPVSPTVALVGGTGYEKLKISQRSVLLDVDGNPVVHSRGGFVTDPSSPRLTAYDVDGFIWDAGVLWRPSRRTSLEARVGERYNTMHSVGTFRWRMSPASQLQVAYFDTIDSFGRAMNGNLVGLPSSFNAVRNPFTGDISGCVSGESGVNCFNDALSAISASNYRHRGVSGQYSHNAGRWNWGAGLGWSQRKFIAPNDSVLTGVDGVRDNYYYGQLFGSYRLDTASSLGGSLYANYLDAGFSKINVTNYGVYATYNRQVGRRLSFQASLGLDSVDTSDIQQVVSLLGQVGVRYKF